MDYKCEPWITTGNQRCAYFMDPTRYHEIVRYRVVEIELRSEFQPVRIANLLRTNSNLSPVVGLIVRQFMNYIFFQQQQ